MKVVAKINSEMLLVEATQTELFNLIGFRSEYLHPGRMKFEPGVEIQVSAMYEQLYDLANKQGRLTQIAAELRIVADLLTLRDPVIQKLTEVKPEEKA